jgi:uncharacterized protein YqgC (DUF456 family)
VFTLPGTWLMLLGYMLFAIVTRGRGYVGLGSIFVMLVLAGVAEIIDTVASGAGAKKAGASRRAMFGAVIGGLLGALFLTFLVPVPVVGTIVGACLGCFLGAGIVEMLIRQDVGHSVKVGLHAAKGRFQGIVVKIMFSLLMFGICAWRALPVHGTAATPAAAQQVAPTTSPTTR